MIVNIKKFFFRTKNSVKSVLHQSHKLEAINDEQAQDTPDSDTTEVDQRHFAVQVQEAAPEGDVLAIVDIRHRIEVSLVLR